MKPQWFPKPEYDETLNAWQIVYHKPGNPPDNKPWPLQFKQDDFHRNPKTDRPKELIDLLEREYDCTFAEARRENAFFINYIATFTTRKKYLKALRFTEAFLFAWQMEVDNK